MRKKDENWSFSFSIFREVANRRVREGVKKSCLEKWIRANSSVYENVCVFVCIYRNIKKLSKAHIHVSLSLLYMYSGYGDASRAKFLEMCHYPLTIYGGEISNAKPTVINEVTEFCRFSAIVVSRKERESERKFTHCTAEILPSRLLLLIVVMTLKKSSWQG